MFFILKAFFKHYLFPFIAIPLLQPLYKLLHRIALVGMNMGPVGEIATSGEARLIRKLMSSAPTDAVICDVGANLGEFAIRCARCAERPVRIFAFEPSPGTFQRLLAELTDPVVQARIVPVQEGLSDQMREATILVTAGFEGNASLHTRHQPHLISTAQSEKIRLNTLDAFCRAHNLERIFFLKVDIEGEEFACLRGAEGLLREGRVDYLQFEFGGCNIQSRVFLKDFWDLLSPTFDLYRILQVGLCPWSRYHELNEVFTTTNFLAVRRGLPSPH